MQPYEHEPEAKGHKVLIGAISFVIMIVLLLTSFGFGLFWPVAIAVAEESSPADVTTQAVSESTTPGGTDIANGRAVPDVTNVEVNDAILKLFDWNLEILRLDEPNDEIPHGLVIRTEPAPGTQVAPNSPILIVVSTGPTDTAAVPPVAVKVIVPTQRPFPDLVEHEFGDAMLVIGEWDLEILHLEEPSDVIPPGHVILTHPVPGTMVEAGSPAILIVSSGPADSTTQAQPDGN